MMTRTEALWEVRNNSVYRNGVLIMSFTRCGAMLHETYEHRIPQVIYDMINAAPNKAELNVTLILPDEEIEFDDDIDGELLGI